MMVDTTQGPERVGDAANAYAESLKRGSGRSEDGIRTVGTDAWVPRAFDIKDLTTTSITVYRCWYMRGTVTNLRAEEPTVALTGTTIIVSAKIKHDTGEVTLEAGAAPYDTASDDTAEYVRMPLYKLARGGTGELWYIEEDYRSMLHVGLYE